MTMDRTSVKVPVEEGSDWMSISVCRACRSDELHDVLSLGKMPLANALFDSRAEAIDAPRYPLTLTRCSACGLVQIRETVEPDLLFRHYAYFSSSSVPLMDHFAGVAGELRERYGLTFEDLVVDVGANDGVFLRHLLSSTRVLGCDPAENVSATAREAGIPMMPRYFNEKTANEIMEEHGTARLVFAANVLGHTSDLNGFMRGAKSLLAPDGVLVIEVHYLLDLINRTCFDQIYHEHCSFFSIATLERLLKQHGFKLVDAGVSNIHGSLLQVHAVHGDSDVEVSLNVEKLRTAEAASGLDQEETYAAFADRVKAVRHELCEWVSSKRSSGKRVVGYGACAKGNILLNYCGLGTDDVEYIVDTTPSKVGRMAPGSGIPIVDRKNMARKLPDYIFLLAWNYSGYILKQEADLRAKGTRFLLPVPRPQEV